MPLPDWLYEAGANGAWIFLLLTVLLGGAAAFVTGRVIAETWRPFWQLPVYILLIACAVRFFHFALFEEKLLSVRNLVVDVLVLIVAGTAGHWLARGRQMAEQYGWLRMDQPPAR